MQLNNAPSPPTTAVGSVKLKHPSGPAVSADGILHGGIFADRGLGKLLAAGQHIGDMFSRIGNDLLDRFLVQAFCLDAIIGKPALHLCHAVRIFQPCLLLHSGAQALLGLCVNCNGLFHEAHIQQDSPVIDFLVEMILVPDKIRHGELRQFLLDGKLYLHISLVIGLEQFPFLRGMAR